MNVYRQGKCLLCQEVLREVTGIVNVGGKSRFKDYRFLLYTTVHFTAERTRWHLLRKVGVWWEYGGS
jgi:hypothetical protein